MQGFSFSAVIFSRRRYRCCLVSTLMRGNRVMGVAAGRVSGLDRSPAVLGPAVCCNGYFTTAMTKHGRAIVAMGVFSARQRKGATPTPVTHLRAVCARNAVMLAIHKGYGCRVAVFHLPRFNCAAVQEE